MTGDPAALEGELLAALDTDPERGAGAAWDLIAGRPEVKPSRGLLIDPGNTAELRWWQAVHGCVALLRSATLPARLADVLAALSEDKEFACDVVGKLAPHQEAVLAGLSSGQRTAVEAFIASLAASGCVPASQSSPKRNHLAPGAGR
jgi:hypothetical protein